MAERASYPRRVAAGAAVGGVASLLTGLVDGRWAAAAQEQSPSLVALALGSAGIAWPLTVGLGLALGVATVLLHPSRSPSPEALRAHVGALDAAAQRRWSLSVVFGALGVCVWLWSSAVLGTRLLASSASAAATGAGMALSALLLALVLGVVSLGAARLAAPRAPTLTERPLVAIAVAAAIVIGFFAIVVSQGTTSGSGGPLALFGVLKRQELDLRAPGLLLAVAAAAYALPALLLRVPLAALIALALAPAGLTWRAGGAALEERRVAIALERDAPLAKLLLPRLRKAFDADGDGFASRFGGGDCNDADPAINPGAEDVPDDGIDQDCSGADARPIVIEKPEQEAPKDAKAWVDARLPKDMNVVLITIDTLRYDLGYMGYERPVSPNIDRLAKKSTVFEQAYALASYTSKSLPPMLIGKYTSETHRGWSHFNRFGPQDTFVQERLQKAGIFTMSVQGYWYFFMKGVGFERGFDVIDSSGAPKAIAVESDKTVNSDKITDAALQQLGKPEQVSKPFFMWVHYVDPHAEYVRHEKHDFGRDSRALYDGEVAFTDEHVGRLLDFIEKSQFSDRTAIIITSDHGEAFGEHGMIRHGFEIWEELVRVPFVIHVPGAEPRRIKERRGIIDVVPTILDLYRLPAPSGEGTDFISGTSLLFDVMNPPGHEVKSRIVFVDMSAGPNNGERQAFIENDLKLMASAGRPTALYDLANDPGEKKDLLDDKAKSDPVVERYRAFRRELREVVVKPPR